MGILKVARSQRHGYVFGVTQTNDPMGILKEGLPIHHNRDRLSYTDQRSDGDTERTDYTPEDTNKVTLHRPTIRWGY